MPRGPEEVGLDPEVVHVDVWTFVEGLKADDPERADFVVSYSVGSRDKLRVTSYPVAYRGPWGWHVLGRRYYVQEYEQHSYTEGTLAVDIFTF